MSRPPLRVAVVDDDPSVLRALERLLAASGMEPHTFESGLQFLRSAARHDWDCVILDMHMPLMTAVDVLQALPALNAKLPALVVTGAGDDEVCSQCEAAGA